MKPPCGSDHELSREALPRGKDGHGVWIVTCRDSTCYWGVAIEPQHDDVLCWHRPFESYGAARKNLEEAKASGGWPELFQKKIPGPVPPTTPDKV